MESQKNNKGLVVLLVIFIILTLVLGGFILYDKVLSDKNPDVNNNSNSVTDNNTTTTQNSTNENNDKKQEIDNDKIEDVIKRVLLEKVAKNGGIWGYDNSIYAEGHKTLRTEIKDNKIYAYVLAIYGTYTKENGNYDNTSGMAGPLVLIFTNNYEFISYDSPASGEGYTDSLKNIFPSDLIDEVTNVDYRTDFYQNQIKSYLD